MPACTWIHHELDMDRVREAVAYLPGRQDFSAFRAAGCQARSPVREITDVSMHQSGPWLWMDISADAFLQHMVRNIVGSLIQVGRGERPPAWIGALIRGRDRTRAGMAAPPDGLYLSEVRYPERFSPPPPPSPVRFW